MNEEQPKLYLVEGHGEADLPSTFAEQVEKDNIETESLSLLHTETIPEDADCLMIYAPESDISEDERDLLAEYVSGGGKLLVIAGPTREDGILENLYSLLSDYGVEPAEGIVVESDSNYYSAFSGPSAAATKRRHHRFADRLQLFCYHAHCTGLDRGRFRQRNSDGAADHLRNLLQQGDGLRHDHLRL